MATFLSPVEVVGMAVQTEQAGRQFYEQAASRAQSPSLKDLFQFLAGEEAKHEQRFASLYDQLRSTPAELPYNWDELVRYLKAITDSRFFLGPGKGMVLAQAAKSEQEALEFALQFEKETLLFYLELRALVGEPHQVVVEAIAREERSHIRRLAELEVEVR